MTPGLGEARDVPMVPPTRQLAVPELGAPSGLRAGLVLAALLFGYGVAIPALLVAWLAIAALLSAGAGMMLKRMASLDQSVLHGSTGLAVGLVVVELAVICLAWVLRLWRASFFARPAGGFVRHPVPLVALVQLAALAAVSLVAGKASSTTGQYTITTVVLANSYFFAVLFVLGSAVLFHSAWHRLHEWGVRTTPRASLFAAALASAGAAGALVQALDWHVRPTAALLERIDLTPQPHPHGAVDLQELALCLASGELISARATNARAPACPERHGP